MFQILQIFPSDLLGEITIVEKHGQISVIKFYWTGKNPVAFTLDGKDFFWGLGGDIPPQDLDGGIRLGKSVRDAFNSAKKPAEPMRSNH
jgi:hypothetical protein